jgi:hypothetical protein
LILLISHKKQLKVKPWPTFFAAHLVLDNSPLVIHLLNEDVFAIDMESPWKLYFDGAQRRRVRVRQVLKIPQGETIYYSFSPLINLYKMSMVRPHGSGPCLAVRKRLYKMSTMVHASWPLTFPTSSQLLSSSDLSVPRQCHSLRHC